MILRCLHAMQSTACWAPNYQPKRKCKSHHKFDNWSKQETTRMTLSPSQGIPRTLAIPDKQDNN